jgi:hypothetical protein
MSVASRPLLRAIPPNHFFQEQQLMNYQNGVADNHPSAAIAPIAGAKRISWGAVFAGVAIILAVQITLALLGAGIGLGTIDPMAQDTPEAATFGTAAGIYWAVSILLSVLLGGWVAGRLAGIPRNFDGLIHGVLAWSVGTLLTVYLLTTSIGGLIGGAFGMVGNVARTATEAASNANPDIAGMAGAVTDKLKQSGIDLGRMKSEAQDPANQQQAQQKAREAADQSASVASKASLFAFLAMILGAAAGAIGGRMGRPKEAFAIR